jgi:hypothetical protein
MPVHRTHHAAELATDEEAEMTEEEAARCFLTLVHQNCRGQVEIRVIHSETKAIQRYWPKSVEQASKFAMERDENENVYFGVCTRKDDSSGKKENLLAYPGVWVDMDFKDFVDGEQGICAKLESFPIRPTLLIHSGGGAQPYWLLNEPIEITTELLPEFESLNARAAEVLGGDSCHDLTRILRIPGTINWPDEKKRRMGRAPAPVQLLWPDGPRYTLKQLQEAFTVSSIASRNETVRENKSQPTTLAIPKRFFALLEQNPKLKATWDGKRKDLKDESGSGYDMALTNQLARHNFTDDEMKIILMSMPSGRGAKAKEAYHDRTIRKARSGQNEDKLSPADWADRYLLERGLKSSDGLLLRCHRDTWLVYNGVSYDPIPTSDIETDVTMYLGASEARHRTTRRFLSDVLLHLRASCAVPSSGSLPLLQTGPEWVESPNFLVVKNGILDLQSLLDDNAVALREHTASLVSTIALPFAFDPTAKCPRWKAFLREIQPDDASRQLLSEIFGYSLTYDTSQQRFFLFEGLGGNGKGVVTNTLTNMVGEANVNSIPLELFAASHGLEVTLGKLVNIISEVVTSIASPKGC